MKQRGFPETNMKLTIATALLAMSTLFAQSVTPPATHQAPTKTEKHKKGKHKKMEEKKTTPTK